MSVQPSSTELENDDQPAELTIHDFSTALEKWDEKILEKFPTSGIDIHVRPEGTRFSPCPCEMCALYPTLHGIICNSTYSKSN